jgi:hypothetical protein
MVRNASPMACIEAAHAVVTVRLGPLAPVKIAICPEAMLGIIMGMKKGLILLGP